MLQKYIFYFRKQRFFLQISQKTCDLEENYWQKVAKKTQIYWKKVVTLQPKQWKKVANMLQRKIIYRLEKWYQSGHYKAPLVFGARQVGKTTARHNLPPIVYGIIDIVQSYLLSFILVKERNKLSTNHGIKNELTVFIQYWLFHIFKKL